MADDLEGAASQAEERVKKLIFALLAFVSGAVLPLQGRINSALSEQTGDPLLSAGISFAGGMVLMALVVPSFASGRRALARVPGALRAGEVKWWYLLVGGVGAYLAFSQTLTIGLLGVAVFTVVVVSGQLLGNILLDSAGMSPAGRKPLTPLRSLGTVLTLVAVVLISLPGLTGEGFGREWLAFAGVVFFGGFINSWQQVINARQSFAYGSALPGTLINYGAGTVLLGVLYAGLVLVTGRDVPWAEVPSLTDASNWWYYLGGPLGCIFIGVGALLISRTGALVAGIGITTGNLLGSLVLDLFAPAPGAQVTVWTAAGVLLALTAAALVTLSGRLSRAERKPASPRTG
ncbi:DMT family transporter [Nesterenkonia populi]